MNLKQIDNEFLWLVILLVISRILVTHKAVRAAQPGTEIEISTSFAAERIGSAIAWFFAVRAGNLRPQWCYTCRDFVRHRGLIPGDPVVVDRVTFALKK